MPTLYQQLTTAGVPTSGHESDLYFQATPRSREILDRYQWKDNVRAFYNQAPPHVGELWYDAPFAFDPFWETLTARSAL